MLLHGKERPETIDLLGGRLCLDFANSVDWTDEPEPLDDATDALLAPTDLARWGRRLLGGTRLARVGADELAAARELRDAVYRAFAAVAAGDAPRRDDLELIAASHAEGAAVARLERRGGAWRPRWSVSDPRRVRFEVAHDAIELLGDADLLARVRRCPGRRCGWLFLDRSGRRKWCSMDTCGSRAKMRRLYARRRGAAARAVR